MSGSSTAGWWRADVLMAAHLRYEHGLSWAAIKRRFNRGYYGWWPQFRAAVEAVVPDQEEQDR